MTIHDYEDRNPKSKLVLKADDVTSDILKGHLQEISCTYFFHQNMFPNPRSHADIPEAVEAWLVEQGLNLKSSKLILGSSRRTLEPQRFTLASKRLTCL
jgi:hypothetical protein